MTSMAAILAVSALLFATAPQTDCKDWKSCQQMALEAAGRQDYDAFHDLSWRAVNAGPRNDPALLTMLARAQSLSGRPHDALVMLQRLATMGVVTDAGTNDDFARVRALPAWAAFEAALAGKSVTATAPSAAAPKVDAPKVDAPKVDAPKVDPAPATAGTTARTPLEAPPAKPPAKEEPPPVNKDAALSKKETPAAKKEAAARTAPTGKAPAPEPRGAKPAAAPLSFSSAGITPSGLAYDGVSSRFIVADGRDRRLLVLGERSGRLSSLAGIDAGFGEITALEIDAREGDLWLVSTNDGTSTLHKLQLISGRVLASIPLPDDLGEARFRDVAVTPLHVLVLDSAGRRVFRAAKKGKSLDLVARLAASDVSTLAPASDTTAYAAYDRGVLRVDLATKSLSVVEPGSARVDLSGVTWMRWHRGSLVAIQRATDGALRLIRMRLDDSGRSVKSVEEIDDTLSPAGPTAATLTDAALYCLTTNGNTEEVVVRKLVLK
jgi:hypothetical protein